MKKFFVNKKNIVITIVLAELILLVLNAFRFNRSESYSFTQDDFLKDISGISLLE